MAAPSPLTMPQLLVCPPASPSAAGAEFGWARATDDDTALAAQGSAPLGLLPASTDLTLLVPASAISWHSLTLPQGSLGSPTRLRAVLDGLLEERLLDDPEQLHFALQPGARTGVPVWVAACDRAALRALVHALEAEGRRVVRIVPEFAPQPEDAPVLAFATGTAQAPQLTVCDVNGVLSLPLDASSLAMAITAPLDTVALSAEPAVLEQTEALAGMRVPIVQTAARWLQAGRGAWDLAQFDLASTGRVRAGKQLTALWQTLRHAPQWRAARWGLVLLLVAQLAGLNAWAWKERRALAAQRVAIHEILTTTFPAVRLVVDAPVQMAREVAALQQATGGVTPSDLEPMLGTLATVLPPGSVPSSIDYSAGQLRLRGLDLSAQAVGKLAGDLGPRGYSARADGDLLLVQAEATR